MALNYNYEASKAYCKQIGLFWLGEIFVVPLDSEAKQLGATQDIVDAGMRHHLWQVKFLFTPSNYCWPSRLMLAFYFLTGWKI